MTAFQPRLPALLRALPDGRLELRSPAVGQWRDIPAPGAVIIAGAPLGLLEILGVPHRLEAPATAAGTILEVTATTGRHAIAYDDLLLILDPASSSRTPHAQQAAPDARAASAAATVIRAPTSGRIYLRPSPDKPPFVAPGDLLTPGTTLCLLEVMKTFNRVHYDLPTPATLVAVLRSNEDDVDPGTPLFEIQPEIKPGTE